MRMLVENDFYFNAKENVGTDGERENIPPEYDYQGAFK